MRGMRRGWLRHQEPGCFSLTRRQRRISALVELSCSRVRFFYTLQLGDDLLSQRLTQLDAPLVE